MLFKICKSKTIKLSVISMIALSALFYSYGNNINAEEEVKIYICYCPGGCLCEYETSKPGGRCVCGLATIPSDREPSDDLEYECDCGTICDCNSKADEPGLCHCGVMEMKEKE